MNYTESTCTTDYSGIISLLEVQVSRFLHGVRHTPLSLLKACFQLPDTSLYSSIGIKNSIRPVWRKSLYPSMSIDLLTVNRGIKNSCILSRRKSLMALYHGTQAIITFLLNNPLYSEFVECRYPSSVKISTVKDSKDFQMTLLGRVTTAEHSVQSVFKLSSVCSFFLCLFNARLLTKSFLHTSQL